MMVNRLIFEGPDDKHVVMNLLFNHEHNGERLCEHFSEKVKDGVDHLIDTLNEELKAPFSAVSCVPDADTDLAKRGRGSRGFGRSRMPCVPPPNADGTIVETNDSKKIASGDAGQQKRGALEDFVGKLIAEGDTLWPKAQADVNGIPQADRRFKETYLSKAHVHTWLAWKEEPGTRMGETFKKKYLDPNHPQATAFVNWIRRLLA
jgi:hypothetical protein